MRIPHKDPNPPDPDPMPVDFPKEQGLTLTDFHPESKETRPFLSIGHNGTSVPHWKTVANEINDLRTRFAKHNPQGINPRCSNSDRAAVLAVYQEALVKLEHASDIDSIKINVEVKTKVSTILDVRAAKPDDSVFYTKDTFLSPLEPHYAQPRLNYYNRDNGDGDDSYYWTGLRRLREWRKGGWPKAYPAKAVEQEMRERKERRRRGRKMLRDTPKEGLSKALKADPLDWGEEVDADPDRPWR